MFTESILKVAESKIRAAMCPTTDIKARAYFDNQMRKARILVLADAVKPFRYDRYPDSFRVKSQSRERTYSPNLSTLDCQCEHGNHQRDLLVEERELCAHLSAAFLYRYCQAELERSLRTLDQMIAHATQPIAPTVAAYLAKRGI